MKMTRQHGGTNTPRESDREFIAWDGEGIDTGRMIEGAREHHFTLLANSAGDELYRRRGIRTAAALKFLCDVGRAHPDAIHVIFSGNYDCNCILRDLTREQLIMLIPEPGGDRTHITHKCRTGTYRIQWVPRKQLTIARYAQDARGRVLRQRKGGRTRSVVESRITLWDVFGFFQGSFVAALEKWCPDIADLDIIRRGKAARGDFDTWTKKDLAAYNAAELRALVLLATKLRHALDSLDLKISRWDGAGAVAAAILKRHDMKQHLPPPPEAVEKAAAGAYFGGRIERGQFGVAHGVMAYDINSAYPATISTLPDLAAGGWRHTVPATPDRAEDVAPLLPRFTLCRISWRYTDPMRYYPFPFRMGDGRVFFPSSGAGWYWLPEVLAAVEVTRHDNVQGIWVHETWAFREDAESPWGWVREYYAERQAMIARGEVGGAEIMIKLGLNSLYGKTAQTVGYNAEDGRRPPYHSIACAGYVTSSTRALLYQAVSLDPDAVIMLATDGVFTTRPLALEIPQAKELGAWGVTHYDDVIAIASGVYMTRKGERWQSMCRGYDRTRDDAVIRARIAEVLDGWKRGADCVYWPSTRFVGGGTAKASALQFARWCCWYDAQTADGTPGRKLQLVPNEFKRRYSGRARAQAHRRLVWTAAPPGLGVDVESTPYFLPWDVIEENELNNEVDDAEL